MAISTPASIYCPRCGASMKMEQIQDEETLARFKDAEYTTGVRGTCSCGVVALLCIKELPKDPTFTLMFNIYKLK